MKKYRKRILMFFLISAILCIATVIYTASVNRYVVKSTEEAIYSHNDEIGDTSADCILILGCGVYADGTPSPMLADRLKTGIELYKKGAAPKIIMSGDHGRENYDEVNVMKQYAIERGVPSEDIFMDHAGFSTYESVYRAKEIFCAESLIIVTQEYHLSRALYIADRFDLEAIGVLADLRSYSGQSMRDKREFIARNKDFLSCIFKPKPTFLGEQIPVNGNGDVTNDK